MLFSIFKAVSYPLRHQFSSWGPRMLFWLLPFDWEPYPSPTFAWKRRPPKSASSESSPDTSHARPRSGLWTRTPYTKSLVSRFSLRPPLLHWWPISRRCHLLLLAEAYSWIADAACDSFFTKINEKPPSQGICFYGFPRITPDETSPTTPSHSHVFWHINIWKPRKREKIPEFILPHREFFFFLKNCNNRKFEINGLFCL